MNAHQYPKPIIDSQKMKLRMKLRRKYIAKKCKQIKFKTNFKIRPWFYVKNDKHELIWCNVFKAAWTSWMYNFKILEG